MHIKNIIKILFFILIAQISYGQTAEQFKPYIKKWEGYSNTPIYRKNGEGVVGIGHNIAYDKNVKKYYSNYELKRIYINDYVKSLDAVRKLINDFDSLPMEAKLVCLSVEWTVGKTGFERFYEFRSNISERRYKAAATELYDSKWATQVSKKRLNDYINKLINLQKRLDN
jgi:GH24 family phage-related lysozyme (muramidase)